METNNKVCPICNSPVEDNENFCTTCGFDLRSKTIPKSEVTPVTASQISQVIEQNKAAFQNQYNVQQVAPVAKKTSPLLYIGIAIIVVALITIAVVTVVRVINKNDKKEDTKNTEQISTEEIVATSDEPEEATLTDAETTEETTEATTEEVSTEAVVHETVMDNGLIYNEDTNEITFKGIKGRLLTEYAYIVDSSNETTSTLMYMTDDFLYSNSFNISVYDDIGMTEEESIEKINQLAVDSYGGTYTSYEVTYNDNTGMEWDITSADDEYLRRVFFIYNGGQSILIEYKSNYGDLQHYNEFVNTLEYRK